MARIIHEQPCCTPRICRNLPWAGCRSSRLPDSRLRAASTPLRRVRSVAVSKGGRGTQGWPGWPQEGCSSRLCWWKSSRRLCRRRGSTSSGTTGFWPLRLAGGGRSSRRTRLPERVIAIPISAARRNHRHENALYFAYPPAKRDMEVSSGGEAATKPVNKSSRIRSAKIRRIRVHQRAIGTHNSPLMNADSADLRGSSRGMRK